MDPATASILLLMGVGSMYMQWDADNKRRVEQRRLQGEQRYARAEAIRSEIGAANQMQSVATPKQAKPNSGPSFAAGSMLGNLPSVRDTNNTSTSSGISGTF
jgi:Tfp pilus assembly protein FimT